MEAKRKLVVFCGVGSHENFVTCMEPTSHKIISKFEANGKHGCKEKQGKQEEITKRESETIGKILKHNKLDYNMH